MFSIPEPSHKPQDPPCPLRHPYQVLSLLTSDTVSRPNGLPLGWRQSPFQNAHPIGSTCCFRLTQQQTVAVLWGRAKTLQLSCKSLQGPGLSPSPWPLGFQTHLLLPGTGGHVHPPPRRPPRTPVLRGPLSAPHAVPATPARLANTPHFRGTGGHRRSPRRDAPGRCGGSASTHTDDRPPAGEVTAPARQAR